MKKFFCFGLKDFCSCDILCADCSVYDNSGGEYREAPKTNGDHIRSMTDEELAAFLDAFCDSSECRAENGAVCPLYASCASYEKGFDWNVWLKQPYKEE